MSQSRESPDLKDIAATRQALLAAILPHVPFDGWSLEALDRAARDIGLAPAIARDLFRHQPVEVLALHSRSADQALRDWTTTDPDFSGLKVRAKIARAVRWRLTQALVDREAVRRGLALLALPQHAGLASRLVWETCDVIWQAAGDRATDFNHYSKRGLLAAVYSSTLLVWLDDDSPDQQRTWAFLDARLANVLSLFGTLGSLAKRFRSAKPPSDQPQPPAGV